LTYADPTFPLRRVKGGSREWGILAVDSLAEVNENFAFLANDRTVKLIRGTEVATISDLNFELKVKGNGTASSPGFSTIDDAYGFFVDGPIHSIYYITFPTEGYTWGYDLKTGMTHTRDSEGVGFWRVNSSALLNGKIICGDSQSPKLWILDPNAKTEGPDDFRCTITTPSYVNMERDEIIDSIELDMEVATSGDPSNTPMMMVEYTKDGGYNWTNKGPISVGESGDYEHTVTMRQFGRLKRGKHFALRLSTLDSYGLQMFDARIQREACI
jgi:Neuraminidase (sialidase)